MNCTCDDGGWDEHGSHCPVTLKQEIEALSEQIDSLCCQIAKLKKELDSKCV